MPTKKSFSRVSAEGFSVRLLFLVFLKLHPAFCADLLGDVVWNLAVVGEFHDVGCAALAHGTEVRGVSEHFAEWDEGSDDFCHSAFGHLGDLAALGVDVSEDVSHVFLGGVDLDLHDRLEEDRLCLSGGIAERLDPGELEGELVGVDVMVASECERRLDVNDWVSGDESAGVGLLEPIMKVEVNTPEEYMGDVLGNLNSKRGQITEMTDRGMTKILRAFVPLSEMFGYSTDLRYMSQGRATYVMEFSHYSQVPNNITEKIRAERGVKFEEDEE